MHNRKIETETSPKLNNTRTEILWSKVKRRLNTLEMVFNGKFGVEIGENKK